MLSVALACCFWGQAALEPGDTWRSLEFDGRERTYLVHVPKGYNPLTPTPVVLAFHGAATNAWAMALFTGLSKKADAENFIVVYPNGTGLFGLFLFFGAGQITGPLGALEADDVGFVEALLDDLTGVANVDSRRVFATGYSNGGFFCYRLAAELSDRIAAIAPVAAAATDDDPQPARPVPVIHFHGTADAVVPFDGPAPGTPGFINFLSVDDTLRAWAQADGCGANARIAALPNPAKDGTRVSRSVYPNCDDGAEVLLYKIEGGGHTWPGGRIRLPMLGLTTRDISANDLMWEFFKRHPLD